ncbi:MAG: hypothetical protein ACFFDF_18475 [Candidatus Odinarchaeota archaeon]
MALDYTCFFKKRELKLSPISLIYSTSYVYWRSMSLVNFIYEYYKVLNKSLDEAKAICQEIHEFLNE